ncbi:MAG TPA: hypothetical protein VHE34_00745 [Puia sp.]|uniref:hypothetical protein n=1 Tax=Puia sp. TaxID=2045100 RepID=UPI002C4962BE|nr:hypothetical protein [Puia sp.]HVU93713.1 hypothetical protein [Puia sp.]
MKRLLLLTASAFLLSLTVYSFSHVEATCTGAKNCRACKNCNYCKHCAKQGGSCGVCKR